MIHDVILVFSSTREKKSKMAERRDAVLRKACDHSSTNLKFRLQSEAQTT